MGRKWIRDFFTYTYHDALGVLLLIGLILAIRIVPGYLWLEQPLEFSPLESHRIDSFLAQTNKNDADRNTVTWYKFDPNAISLDSLKRLGLKQYLAKRIIKYRSAGYSFYQPKDVLKIYGMDTSWYRTAEKWIYIKKSRPKISAKKEASWSRQNKDEWKPYEKKTWKPVVVDIARADSITLMKVRGIGPVLASRIVKYRNLLGGFHSLEQLREVYGIDDERYTNLLPYLKLSVNAIDILDLTKAKAYELSRHPYLEYHHAKAIVAYRNAHPGEGLNARTLSKIRSLDSATIARITPYLAKD